MQHRNMWGIGASTVTKIGKAGSHRPKPITERRGEFANAEELQALAESAGVSIKRIKRDIHIWRKTGRLPTWA